MKKVFKILLSSFALFSLIACVDTNNDSSSENKIDSSSIESPSSSSLVPQEVYYHVTFLNYDETKLYEVDVLEGHEAVYSGETPIRPEDDDFTYTFKEWDKDLSKITEDVTTKAVYDLTAKNNWGPIII
ncbi:MAG: hypothetical protein IJR08_01915 [Bacilli bacterium]|nr:hypothetical protein [Bacilli bacterium]